DDAVGREDLLDVRGVRLAAVGDADLLGGEVHAPGRVVVGGDQLGEKGEARLRRIAAEGLHAAHLRDGVLHRPHDGGRQRPGDVSDPEADQLRGRIGLPEGLYTLGDVGKEVAALDREVVIVDARHGALLYRAVVGRRASARPGADCSRREASTYLRRRMPETDQSTAIANTSMRHCPMSAL